jgi:hypothetical protein
MAESDMPPEPSPFRRFVVAGTELPPEPMQVPFIAKQPLVRLIPFAAVELADVPERFRYDVLMPAPKVEVAEPNMLVAPLLPTQSPFVEDKSVDEAFPKVLAPVTDSVPSV